MKLLKSGLLALTALLVSASYAHAQYGVSLLVNTVGRPGNTAENLSIGDKVTVDVFLDSTAPNLQFFAVSVMGSDSVFNYLPADSEALDVIYPAPLAAYGTTGAAPGYILYTMGAMTVPTTALYPLQNPFVTWPNPPANLTQVNINYADPAFNGVAATGTNIWVASLVFEVADIPMGVTESDLMISVTGGGNTISTRDGTASPVDICSASVPSCIGVTIGAPITVTLPEPAVAMLAAAALVAVGGIATYRRRRA